MTGLTLWKDQEIERLRRDVDRIFRICCGTLRVSMTPLVTDTPFRTDLSETDDALVVIARLPGIRREDVTLSVTESSLTIDAKHADGAVDETTGYFFQTIRLPRSVDTDRIEASFSEETLRIVAPKRRQHRKEGIKIQVR